MNASDSALDRLSILWGHQRGGTEAEQEMIAELERVLPEVTRETIKAGTILFHEGDALDGIYIRLRGRVSLERRVDGRDVIFHSNTAGPIIGVMALSEGNGALYTCRAGTDIDVIRVSFDQLSGAFRSSQALADGFAAVLMRSLVRRNRRALELRLEVDGLNRQLAKERDELASTVAQLKQAHLRLVQSEKMATLGQLVAGVAHELNNPVAAIIRAAEFCARDFETLISDHPDGRLRLQFVGQGRELISLSSREARRHRETLEAELGDNRLAGSLVKIGLVTMPAVRETLGDLRDEAVRKQLSILEQCFDLGRSLQNIQTCAERLSGLVTSLRSYSRRTVERASGVDVLRGLEETLVLFGHALRGVEVLRDYHELPTIEAAAGEINQVWTNIIANAIQAMDGEGQLRVASRVTDSGESIAVSIQDSGPGMAPDIQSRIFDINFTTKQGRVEYGIGLGLPICRDIIHQHGGAIQVQSRPGETTFTVILPVKQPNRNVADGTCIMDDIVILCIEDEPAVREAIVRDLEGFAGRFRIEDVEDVAEAEEVMAASQQAGRRIGLILCDHVLPDESGVDFLVRLNRDPACRQIRKILITGQAGHEDTIRALNLAEIDYYIAKPWQPDSLRDVVRHQLTEFVLGQELDMLPYVQVLDGERLLAAIASRGFDR